MLSLDSVRTNLIGSNEEIGLPVSSGCGFPLSGRVRSPHRSIHSLHAGVDTAHRLASHSRTCIKHWTNCWSTRVNLSTRPLSKSVQRQQWARSLTQSSWSYEDGIVGAQSSCSTMDAADSHGRCLATAACSLRSTRSCLRAPLTLSSPASVI